MSNAVCQSWRANAARASSTAFGAVLPSPAAASSPSSEPAVIRPGGDGAASVMPTIVPPTVRPPGWRRPPLLERCDQRRGARGGRSEGQEPVEEGAVAAESDAEVLGRHVV